MNKTKIYILDASAILSGKTINLDNAKMITTQSISDELKPGGRDYQIFQYLLEQGLSIQIPTRKSIEKIKDASDKTGDTYRLSKADAELLALALEISEDDTNEVTILTDDYSIQNVAHFLKIKFESISQSGITKRFKWTCRCRGCGKKFKDNIKICPICGAETKTVILNREDIGK